MRIVRDTPLSVTSGASGKAAPSHGVPSSGVASGDRFTGSTGSAARTLDSFLSDFVQGQGRTNGCGTTSLAAILSYWAGQPKAYDRETLDASLRLGNSPTLPTSIVPFLERNGFRASLRGGASLQDLKSMIDQGVPVQVLIDTGSEDDLLLHYVAVVDYTLDAEGRISGIVTADSNLNGGLGGQRTYPAAAFEAKWSGLKLKGVDTGLDRVMITALPQKPVRVEGKDGTVRSTSDIAFPEARSVGWQAQTVGVLWDVALRVRNGGRTGLQTIAAAGTQLLNAGRGLWGRLFG